MWDKITDFIDWSDFLTTLVSVVDHDLNKTDLNHFYKLIAFKLISLRQY